MLKIGITGGIGSGKSTVARIFEALGIPVYNADNEAKKMMNEEGPLKNQIILHFGSECYKNGQLDRRYFAAEVFNNPEKLALLNSLVHPLTHQHADSWFTKQKAPYALKEAALIFESGGQGYLDYIIGVTAPKSLRIQRVIKRDLTTREQVLARIEKQIDEAIKMRLCDFVIINDDRQAVLPQVLALHKKLTAFNDSNRPL